MREATNDGTDRPHALMRITNPLIMKNSSTPSAP